MNNIKARGSRNEVWAGTARQTSGGLQQADMMLNKRGKLVSIRQSAAATLKYPELKAKLCAAPVPTLTDDDVDALLAQAYPTKTPPPLPKTLPAALRPRPPLPQLPAPPAPAPKSLPATRASRDADARAKLEKMMIVYMKKYPRAHKIDHWENVNSPYIGVEHGKYHGTYADMQKVLLGAIAYNQLAEPFDVSPAVAGRIIEMLNIRRLTNVVSFENEQVLSALTLDYPEFDTAEELIDGTRIRFN
jgi:hypothetical protein